MRTDVTSLVLGLLFALLAVLGLWRSFASVNWTAVGILVPVCLVAFGAMGLILSRTKP